MRRLPLFLALAPALSQGGALDGLDDFRPSTAAHMEQTIPDAPGAVTVITGQQIRQLGIRSVAEVMRLVPGFNVAYSSPFAWVARGATQPIPRRFQLLVDGVTEVNPLVGVTHWEILPVAIDRIERIEVVRSQSTPSYGPNAFYGTINIIRKAPQEIIGNRVSASASELGGDLFAEHAGKVGSTTYALDLSGTTFDRYDEYRDGSDRDDDFDETTLGITTNTTTRRGEIDFTLYGTRSSYGRDISRTQFGQEDPVVFMDSWVAAPKYTMETGSHTLSVQAVSSYKDFNLGWDTCAPKSFFLPALGQLFRDNEDLVLAVVNSRPLPAATPDQLSRLSSILAQISTDPTSFQTVCGETNVDYRYRNHSVTAQDVILFSDKVRTSTYIRLAQSNVLSETYGNGLTTIDKSSFFNNTEFQPTDVWTFNAGFMIESFGFALSDPQFSPRLSATYDLTDDTHMKVVASQGKRLIDGIEAMTINQAPTHFSEDVYGSRVQSGFLAHFPTLADAGHIETIRAYDLIVYKGPIELRYFREMLSNIFDYQDADADEIKNVDRRGGEASIAWVFGKTAFRTAFHYIDSSSLSAFDTYSAYGGSAYVIHPLTESLTGSFAYFGSSPVNYSGYDRFDVRLAKAFRVSTNAAEVAGVLSHHRAYEYNSLNFDLQDGGTITPVNELRFEGRVEF